MIRKIIFSGFFAVILLLNAKAQQYDARSYWKMEHDSAYVSINNRQKAGETLSAAEQLYLSDYKFKLAAYFEKMPDAEKSDYFRNRQSWNERPARINIQEEDQVFTGERSTYTKYIVSSGVWGAFYGLSLDFILGLQDGGAAGFPFVTGGIGTLIPVITVKDKKVTTNSLHLSLHGKSIGAFQGAMLGLLLTGGNTGNESGGKLTAGLATASSIALGRIGYNLGKTKDWSQGRVSLYSHYGWLIPLEFIALTTALNIDEPRVYGLTSLIGGVGGYFIADRVADRYNFTRGDIVSMKTLTLLNAGLGFGIMNNVNSSNSSAILIPAAGAMAGTLVGQAWMKNVKLTNQQGRNVALTSGAGAVIGMGIVMIAGEGPPFSYIIPYTTAMISYALITETYRTKNNMISFRSKLPDGLQFSFMPQNILINNKMISSGKIQLGSRYNMLPAFAATMSF
ncbi:MAG: hypothetical protein ABR974_04110 [Bacteroidales bacterium]|jgi:hypothetical protein